MTQIVVLYDPIEGGVLFVDNLIYRRAGEYEVVGTCNKISKDRDVLWAFAGDMNAARDRELKRICADLSTPATYDNAVECLDSRVRAYDIEGVVVTPKGLLLAAGEFGVAEIGPELDRRSCWVFGEFSGLISHISSQMMNNLRVDNNLATWSSKVGRRLAEGFQALVNSDYRLFTEQFRPFDRG